MEALHLQKHSGKINHDIILPSSKSESNRALIINALSQAKSDLLRLANARDTETMQRLLKSSDKTVDVLDAGTTMRFLTAYHAVLGHNVVMTGSERMQQRPIGILVNALRELGTEIEYLKKDGYPPFEIKGFQYKGNNNLTVRGDVSSQYITALLMVSPYLPNGLTINFEGKVGSWSYIDMTLRMMHYFGIQENEGNSIMGMTQAPKSISIKRGNYKAQPFEVEADWSAASYWYSIVALAPVGSEIRLAGLKPAQMSLQGDAALHYNQHSSEGNPIGLMEQLGVDTNFDPDTKITTLKNTGECTDQLTWDFTHCPDIAQTISVICAAKGISASMTGLESLRIKETDRIQAIEEQLTKFNVGIQVKGDEAITIKNPQIKLSNNPITIDTYEDHRMAMAFAPLALLQPITIKDPSVVNKSYPNFWKDLARAGFSITDL